MISRILNIDVAFRRYEFWNGYSMTMTCWTFYCRPRKDEVFHLEIFSVLLRFFSNDTINTNYTNLYGHENVALKVTVDQIFSNIFHILITLYRIAVVYNKFLALSVRCCCLIPYSWAPISLTDNLEFDS